jgi:hypothetical protein
MTCTDSYPRCAFFKALASDWLYARLVYVAPETTWICALCAWIASLRNMGPA